MSRAAASEPLKQQRYQGRKGARQSIPEVRRFQIRPCMMASEKSVALIKS